MAKDSMESKKLALLYIKEILERYSDYEHHLTQDDIIRYLERDYNLVIERKAVARNLSLLKESGMEIESDSKGTFLAVRQFDDSELRILLDGILSSPFISRKDSNDLIKRICSLSSVYFPIKNKHIYTVQEWRKENNPQLLYNIDLVCEAIERKKKINITFTYFEADKKRHDGLTLDVSPVALFLVEQEYLLLFIWDLNQGDPGTEIDPILWSYPLRNMKKFEILESEEAIPAQSLDFFKDGVRIPKFIHEYGIGKEGAVFSLESGKRQMITLAGPKQIIGDALDYFGNDITVSKIPPLSPDLLSEDLLWRETKNYERMVKISAYTTENTAVRFAFVHAPFVVILNPESTKKKMQENVEQFVTLNKKLCESLEAIEKK